MSVDFETIKSKIEEKLPEMLPKAIKWIIVHLLMLLYHFRMPIWATALKASKTVKNIKSGSQNSEETVPDSKNSHSYRRRLRKRRNSRRLNR